MFYQLTWKKAHRLITYSPPRDSCTRSIPTQRDSSDFQPHPTGFPHCTDTNSRENPRIWE